MKPTARLLAGTLGVLLGGCAAAPPMPAPPPTHPASPAAVEAPRAVPSETLHLAPAPASPAAPMRDGGKQ